MEQYFIAFHGQKGFHRVDKFHLLFILSLIYGHLRCFYLLATMNNIAMNIHVHIFECTQVFFFLEMKLLCQLSFLSL